MLLHVHLQNALTNWWRHMAVHRSFDSVRSFARRMNSLRSGWQHAC